MRWRVLGFFLNPAPPARCSDVARSGSFGLDAELLADGLGNGVLVDEDVHGLVGDVGLGGVEHALVGAVLTPAVLYHEVFLARFVLGQSVDDHAVVVGGFPVVVAALAHFLRDDGFVLGVGSLHFLAVGAGPAGSVAAAHVVLVLFGGNGGNALAAEALFADIGTPCEAVAVAHGALHNLHELVEGEVIAASPAPVVLDFEDEGLVERLVGVAGEAYVVVEVEAKHVAEALGGVGLAFVLKGGGVGAEVVFQDEGEFLFPAEGYLLGFALGDALDVAVHDGVELLEVEEAVAVEAAGEGHGAFGNDAVLLEAVENVVEGAPVGKGNVAVGAYGAVSAVHVGVFYDEAFAEVELALTKAEELCLEEAEAAVAPAGAATVLVLDARDGVFLHGCELGAFALCKCGEREGCKGSEKDFSHVVGWPPSASLRGRSSGWR